MSSDILISETWLQSNPESGSTEISLYVSGLGETDSFDIEAATDLATNFWHPIFRHTYELVYGHGASSASGGYGYGYGFHHALSFGYGYGRSFTWSSDYAHYAGSKTFYRVCDRTAVPATSEMVLVPAGTNSGTDPDFGAYNLTNETAFYMDKYEVTQAYWDEVRNWSWGNGYRYDNAGAGKAATHPVHTVNWYDCVKWCNARSEKEGLTPAYYTDAGFTQVYKSGQVSELFVEASANGYRLPTDQEWEYAARGGAASKRFPWGDSDNISHTRANYRAVGDFAYDESNGAGYHPTYNDGTIPYTSPAGSFAANGYGLYDMADNVREWCYDWYPGSVGSLRVFRGGSWINGAAAGRVGFRHNGTPEAAFNFIGFRTVLPPASTSTTSVTADM